MSLEQNITIFKNIKETDTPFHRPIGNILQRIKNGATKDLVKQIRQEKRKGERNELKKKTYLLYVSQVYLIKETTMPYKNTQVLSVWILMDTKNKRNYYKIRKT